MRTLVAGFGNVLRGDDGVGVEVVHRLERAALPDSVRLLEIGTGGLRLAQELFDRYDRLIIVDAMTRGRAPGTVYVLQVDAVEEVDRVDLHAAVPARALSVASALGVMPPEVFMVGCEPECVDDLLLELSPAVQGSVDEMMRRVRELVERPSGVAAPAQETSHE